MNFKGSKKWFNKRENAKQINLQKSKMAFDETFFVYYPSPEVDLKKYTNEDDGTIDLDQIPSEQLLEFECQYITPGAFEQICAEERLNLNDIVDIKKFHKKSKEEVEAEAEELNKRLAEALLDKMTAEKSASDIAYEVAFTSCKSPQFESIQQVKDILPLTVVDIITEEAIKFTDGSNLVMED